MTTSDATEKKPLWLSIEENILGLGSQDLSAANLEASIQRVAGELDNVKAGFEGYTGRIEALRARILALLPDVQLARSDASQQLQQLALKELKTRKLRLSSYRSQARYALARSYDQVAQQAGEQP